MSEQDKPKTHWIDERLSEKDQQEYAEIAPRLVGFWLLVFFILSIKFCPAVAVIAVIIVVGGLLLWIMIATIWGVIVGWHWHKKQQRRDKKYFYNPASRREGDNHE